MWKIIPMQLCALPFGANLLDIWNRKEDATEIQGNEKIP